MQSDNSNLNSREIIFFETGKKISQSAIIKGLTNNTLFEAIKELLTTIDDFNNSVLELAKVQNINIACKNVCEWCCHQAVYANSYELHYLSEYLKSNFSEVELNAIRSKVKLKLDKTNQLTEDENLIFKYPCPLLKEGSCIAYKARPVACRIYLSKNLESCLKFYKNPENVNYYPELLDFPLTAGRLMNEGFMSALFEDGIDTIEFRIEEGLSILI